MFRNFFKRSHAPTTSAANPAKAIEIRGRGANGAEISVHAVRMLAEVLRARGHSPKEHASWLELEPGLTLQPRVLSVEALEKGRWRTATTIELQHAAPFSGGVFEYQHAAAEGVPEAIRSGFEQFESLDLPVLVEAISGKLRRCARVDCTKSYAKVQLPRPRRVVLGPIIHQVNESAAREDEAHPFCPCCFFTHSTDVMQEKLRATDFFAIRLLAARYEDGEISADCRVNGIDWPEGAQALRAYAATWPQRGFELRKQYIAIQNLES